jgi:hypothetical protein
MRDKNILPLDMVCDFLIGNALYGSTGNKFQKRFGLKDWNEREKKINEFRKLIQENPDPHILRIMKSTRLCGKYIEHLRERMKPEIEQAFFEKQKNTWIYYDYCARFNIIVEEFNQIVTEVALECDNIYHKEDYLEKVLEKRKNCKTFIEEHMRHLEISPTESIQKLIESLSK